MSTAIIELNDSGILYHAPGCTEASTASPGYALLLHQGVVTGQQALRQAWLQPQQSFNQYWYQLSLSPLGIANQHARHYADLAYAQLQQLYADAGQPQHIIFAMPSNTSAEHLAILLGLVKASPFNAGGLVDAAVAAASQTNLKGKLLHLDIQLHTTVLSHLNSGDLVQRETASQYPDISLKAIHDTWAQFIADRFIHEYRYDPLHTAAGEQELHDRLPDWIGQLNSAAEIETELSAPQGNFRLRIQRSEFIAANQNRWQRLSKALAGTTFDSLLLSHRLAHLPGVIDCLNAAGHSNIVTLAADASIAACLAHSEAIAGASDKHSGDTQLSFITALPALSAPAKNHTPQDTGNCAATHLLKGHRAYSLAQGLLLLSDGTPLCADKGTHNLPSQAVAELHFETNRLENDRFKEGRLVLSQSDRTIKISCNGDWQNLSSGDVIHLAGQTLHLIEVD